MRKRLHRRIFYLQRSEDRKTHFFETSFHGERQNRTRSLAKGHVNYSTVKKKGLLVKAGRKKEQRRKRGEHNLRSVLGGSCQRKRRENLAGSKDWKRKDPKRLRKKEGDRSKSHLGYLLRSSETCRAGQ